MDESGPDRREVLSTAVMAGSLLGAYGTFFYIAGRYLYPSADGRKTWLFVARTDEFPVGSSMEYRAPSGARILVTRRQEDDYLALSSTCPHLGCQVRWEGPKNRFFCPCHNGVFTPEGKGIEGPPDGMDLFRYPMRVEGNLLYIEVPVDQVARGGLSRPGHDSCLEM